MFRHQFLLPYTWLQYLFLQCFAFCYVVLWLGNKTEVTHFLDTWIIISAFVFASVSDSSPWLSPELWFCDIPVVKEKPVCLHASLCCFLLQIVLFRTGLIFIISLSDGFIQLINWVSTSAWKVQLNLFGSSFSLLLKLGRETPCQNGVQWIEIKSWRARWEIIALDITTWCKNFKQTYWWLLEKWIV